MAWKNKESERVYRLAYYQSHKEKKIAASRAYKQSHKEELKAYNKKYKQEHKEQRRAHKLSNLYNFSLEEYNNMKIEQEGLCLICRRVLPEGYSAYVDHDHSTGRVRGLLCRACNTLLGMAEDNITILEHAIKYLKREL